MARPNIRDLASAVHNAGNPAQPTAGPDTAKRVPKTRQGTKGVLIHVTPPMSKALRQLALDEDTTLQALGVEAFERLLEERTERTERTERAS